MTPYEEQRILDLPTLIVNEKDREKAIKLSLELLRLLEKAEKMKARETSRLRFRFRGRL
jgi:hypothetical protein